MAKFPGLVVVSRIGDEHRRSGRVHQETREETTETERAEREAQKENFSEEDMDSLLERMTAEYHRSTSA